MQKKPSEPKQLSLSLFGEVENASSNNELILAKLGKQIRTGKHPKTGDPCVIAVDLIAAWTDSAIPKRYWTDLKAKLLAEGFQLYEKIVQLKIQAADGKMYSTDALDIETALRVMQSIPSPKAEPIKQWLAQLGKERIEETIDPELGISRARERARTKWKKQGYDDEWIGIREETIDVRNFHTDVLKAHGNKTGKDYAKCTDATYKGTTGGMDTEAIKKALDLKKGQNPRDYMKKGALMAVKTSEFIASLIMEKENTQGFNENLKACEKGAETGHKVFTAIEEATGRSALTGKKLLSA